MTFQQFAEAHGLILTGIITGRWVRVPTREHPKKRNGAYKLMGNIGWVQNWATQTEPSTWKGGAGEIKVDRALIQKADTQVRMERENAARKAERILSECELLTHPYFADKGFPELMVNVWKDFAVIPMRIGKQIVGCQMISPDGSKKFLTGQASGGAEFVFGGRGIDVLCEGYATALSVREALKKAKPDARLHVTFSAGNMKRIAERLGQGLVIADNDASRTGERVAQEIGWPYWISDTVGEDANDAHQRIGTFALSQQIRRVLMNMRC